MPAVENIDEAILGKPAASREPGQAPGGLWRVGALHYRAQVTACGGWFEAVGER